MRAVVQRVEWAKVEVDSKEIASISRGLLVYIAAGEKDEPKDVEYMATKIAHLRVFEDEYGYMNRSVIDIKGEVLVVSQFTLYGDCRKGRRPSFSRAMDSSTAKILYEMFIQNMKKLGLSVSSGRFQSMMKVSSSNLGPVTLLLDSSKLF
jgi:D-tyrosyl-tRNA(Tyr) deacylase